MRSLLTEAFEHRSGRVVSLARLVLAAVFLVAIYADPSQPSRYPADAYTILAGYVAVSAAYLGATWNHWWLEHRLAIVAHVFDIALFGAMVYLTDGYTSPFFTFFVFIIFSAAIRWSWRETAATAAAVVLMFAAAGFPATNWDAASVELTRFIIRGTYLLVLSLLMVWFAINLHRRYRRHLFAIEPGREVAPAELPVRAGLEHAAARLGAQAAALLWWDDEEPWLNLARLRDGSLSEDRFPPSKFGHLVHSSLAGRVFIFDQANGRVLAEGQGAARRLRCPQPIDPELAAIVGESAGLAVPVEADGHGGLFILTGIDGLCADDLDIGRLLADDFSATLRRSAALALSDAAAASRTRLSLARDLHDSVVQLLAGTAMRLQGLKQAAASGRDVSSDLNQLQEELGEQQRGLRELIGELRDTGLTPSPKPLEAGLRTALERAARQWGISSKIERCPADATVTADMQHQLDQLLREAIANAVKHGGASQVRLSAELADSELMLKVSDNGRGFRIQVPRDGVNPGPWSLNERVHALDGTLMMSSTGNGSEVSISLPWEQRP